LGLSDPGFRPPLPIIRDILTQDYGYIVCPIIKISTIISSELHRIGKEQICKVPFHKYITEMQTAGNDLRKKLGNNYLAEKVVEQICKFRKGNDGYSENNIPLPGRRAYIIDSLKNPEELALLRSIYGETLCIFGIFAPDSLRIARLKDMGIPKDQINKIINRDQGEVETFGQKTRKVFVDSDFFLCNDRKSEELRNKIFRFLDIIFNTSIHTPTIAEAAMYKASAVAGNSGCMSRQVGAAIVSENGELIAVGWNDVPRFGGGLYVEDHQSLWDEGSKGMRDKDYRCFKWGGNICHNETKRLDILDKITTRIVNSGLLKKGKSKNDIREILDGTEIDYIIEYSRAIHAEMEAILSVAREGRHSLSRATLYTNTYPCHNCARHIVASGIKAVFYIEPYLKSLAIELHPDSVTEDPDDDSRVVFRQYDGVAPRNYLRLFRPSAPRKDAGKLIVRPRSAAVPIFRVQLDGPADYEAKVIADLIDKEQATQ
jgi:deoxycytidylate deaminase